MPLFNFRGAGATSERQELNFEMNLADQVLTLVPAGFEEMSIKFFASKGTYIDRKLRPTSMATPNYLIEENHYYEFDNRNGSRGLDNHYTPYDLVV